MVATRVGPSHSGNESEAANDTWASHTPPNDTSLGRRTIISWVALLALGLALLPALSIVSPADLSQRIVHVPQMPHSSGCAKNLVIPSRRPRPFDRPTILHWPIRPHLSSPPPISLSRISAQTNILLIFVLITVIAQPTLTTPHAMASTMDNTHYLFQQLEQTKQNFWNSHAHLTENERQDLWSQATALPPNNAFGNSNASTVQQTPRSMPSSNLTHLPVWIPFWCSLAILTHSRQWTTDTRHPA